MSGAIAAVSILRLSSKCISAARDGPETTPIDQANITSVVTGFVSGAIHATYVTIDTRGAIWQADKRTDLDGADMGHANKPKRGFFASRTSCAAHRDSKSNRGWGLIRDNRKVTEI